MRSFYVYKIWTVYCSFAIAIILQFVFSFLTVWYLQPSWVMMLLIYWIVVLPKKVNIGTGFVLGLIIDFIFGSILGVHALSLSILSYLTVRKIYFFRHVSVWQQSFFILFLSLMNQSIKLSIKFLITKILYSPDIFWNCILDGVTWPFLIFLMRKVYRY